MKDDQADSPKSTKSKRRHLDQYFTPQNAVNVLIDSLNTDWDYPILLNRDLIFECCAGEGAIASVLEQSQYHVLTNDIFKFKDYRIDFCYDATESDLWQRLDSSEDLGHYVNWVITNPPFNCAAKIIEHALDLTPNVAFLLRLSWLQGCRDRADLLRKKPPKQLIVLPRISFTGDGKTDNVTCAWFVWSDRAICQKPIKVISKFTD